MSTDLFKLIKKVLEGQDEGGGKGAGVLSNESMNQL